MSDTFWIAVVIGITIIAGIFILRHSLKGFTFGAGKSGIRASATTHGPDRVTGPAVRRNWMIGKKHKIDAAGRAAVDDNVLVGEESEVNAGGKTPSGRPSG